MRKSHVRVREDISGDADASSSDVYLADSYLHGVGVVARRSISRDEA